VWIQFATFATLTQTKGESEKIKALLRIPVKAAS